MADTRKLVVEFIDKVEKRESESATVINNSGTVEIDKMIKNPSTNAQTLGQSVFLSIAFTQAKQVTTTIASYALNRHFDLTEDYIGETNTKFALQIIKKSVSLGSSIVAGGIAGGPIGAAAAAVGFVGVETIQAFQRLDQINIKMREMAYSTSYNQERLGLIDGGKGTEN